MLFLANVLNQLIKYSLLQSNGIALFFNDWKKQLIINKVYMINGTVTRAGHETLTRAARQAVLSFIYYSVNPIP